MIRKVRIENFKSISDLSFDLGRINVFIGANGSGKSNILEAIAFAAGATERKLDNEFLASRGIRATEARWMRPAFPMSYRNGKATAPEAIQLSIRGEDEVSFECKLIADESVGHRMWINNPGLSERVHSALTEILRRRNPNGIVSPDDERKLIETMANFLPTRYGSLPRFLIYSPENTALRTFEDERQILPLGVRGEGLFAHLKRLNTGANGNRIERINESLKLIDWFESFEIPPNLSPGERTLRIRDSFLAEGAYIDQRSANEGFLFLLFYLTLFISPDTPEFFAIDNVDASLNPKLCAALVEQMVLLAQENNKQAILTTHNPAVLDGLNLHDDEQRLFVVDRNKEGHTRIRRVEPPKQRAGEPAASLSEAFMRGYIGGLPKNF